jgi:hypothetical protein
MRMMTACLVLMALSAPALAEDCGPVPPGGTFGAGCKLEPVPAPSFPLGASAVRPEGFELYSWKEGRSWRYVVLPATPRVRTLAEIQGSREILRDEAALRRRLARLRKGETVTWMTQGPAGVSAPGRDRQRGLREHARLHGVSLHVPGEPTP